MISTAPRPRARAFCGIFASSNAVLAYFKATISPPKANRIAEHNVKKGGGGEGDGGLMKKLLKHKDLRDQGNREWGS